MNYNSKRNYNHGNTFLGAFYNSLNIAKLIQIFDSFSSKEPDETIIASIIILEYPKYSDQIKSFSEFSFNDNFYIDSSIKNFALLDLLENQYAKDTLSKIIVSLFVQDNYKFIDQIYKLNAIISKVEKTNISDLEKIEAIITEAETQNLSDAEKLFVNMLLFDTFGMTDREPRSAISDFLIGKVDDKDSAYDWLIPFDMKVDWRNSSIQVMPQSESDYIEMPGVDGSEPSQTTYKNRFFNIVAFSELGLSIEEKEQLKSDIARILDSTKKQTKKLVFQASSTSFDVKYSGSAEIAEGPSYVKATIPLEASPYGYPLFEQELYGSGLLVNDGIADSGCVHRITGPISNPSFKLGQITYTFNGTVPENTTLVIDHSSYSCYFETVQGTRTNVLSQLTGEFQVIPKESSVAIVCDENTESHIMTTLKERILWKGF